MSAPTPDPQSVKGRVVEAAEPEAVGRNVDIDAPDCAPVPSFTSHALVYVPVSARTIAVENERFDEQEAFGHAVRIAGPSGSVPERPFRVAPLVSVRQSSHPLSERYG